MELRRWNLSLQIAIKLNGSLKTAHVTIAVHFKIPSHIVECVFKDDNDNFIKTFDLRVQKDLEDQKPPLENP